MSDKKIVIIDYGMGNVGSVAAAIDYLQGNYLISNKRKDLAGADALILPGVGAFGAAIENLQDLGLVEELNQQVLMNKKPFLTNILVLEKSFGNRYFINIHGWVFQ